MAQDDWIDKRTLRWLAAALLSSLALNLAIAAGLTAYGEPADEVRAALGATLGTALIEKVPGEDSWWAMLEAYQHDLNDPEGDLYRVFFVDRIKFQYPPSSLLILDLFPRSVTKYLEEEEDDNLERFSREYIAGPSRLACLIAILCSALIVELGLRRLRPGVPARPGLRAARIGISIALGLTFYPLLKSYELGQIQVFLNAAVAAALLLILCGWQVASAVLLSACCLIKPQYGVVVIAALLLRQWRFVATFFGTAALGLCMSLLRFGFTDHLRYLDVLRAISRQGETYWPNQSVNGLLNRFLENGDAVDFHDDQFAPYIAGVYFASLASALLLFALAFGPLIRQRMNRIDPRYAFALTLALAIAASTMGSPVAWEHHYGAFLAFFALSLPVSLIVQPLGRWTAPVLALSYVSVANVMLRPDLLFANRWLGLLGSHLFFGALLLFALLYAARRSSTVAPDAPRVTEPAGTAQLGEFG